jgi:hypothetical protein
MGLQFGLLDMRHIDGPRVSNNEWIRKCQYQELRWALKQIYPTATDSCVASCRNQIRSNPICAMAVPRHRAT